MGGVYGRMLVEPPVICRRSEILVRLLLLLLLLGLIQLRIALVAAQVSGPSCWLGRVILPRMEGRLGGGVYLRRRGRGSSRRRRRRR